MTEFFSNFAIALMITIICAGVILGQFTIISKFGDWLEKKYGHISSVVGVCSLCTLMFAFWIAVSMTNG